MSEETETSSDEIGERRITVRRLIPANGVTHHQIIRAVCETLQGRSVRTISVAIVDDATIASLHERYLGEATVKDVLSFDLRDDPGEVSLEGEIVVSAEAAVRQASSLGVDQKQELLRYVIHGTLHLLGYEDDTTGGRRRMRRAENRVLAVLKAPPRRSKRRNKQRRKSGSV